jgi:hypothetical protein
MILETGRYAVPISASTAASGEFRIVFHQPYAGGANKSGRKKAGWQKPVDHLTGSACEEYKMAHIGNTFAGVRGVFVDFKE